jgi:hypothetical protein
MRHEQCSLIVFACLRAPDACPFRARATTPLERGLRRKARQQQPCACGRRQISVTITGQQTQTNILRLAAGQLVFVGRTINMSLFTSHPILVVGAIIMEANQRIPRECSSSQTAEQVEDYMDGDDDGQVWRSIGRQLRQISEHYQVETSTTKNPTNMITSIESIKFDHQTECPMLQPGHRTALYSIHHQAADSRSRTNNHSHANCRWFGWLVPALLCLPTSSPSPSVVS